MGGHLSETVNLQTAFTQAQQEYFFDHPEVNPSEICISVGSISAQMEGIPITSLQMTDIQQQLFSSFNEMFNYGELGVTLAYSAIKSDSLFCSMPHDAFDGFYNRKDDIVFITPELLSENDLPQTVLEEFGHAEQNRIVNLELFFDETEDLAPKDRLTAAISTEAQIKLSIAHQAASSVWHNGDTELFDSLSRDSVTGQMADSLMDIVSEQGIAALDDPKIIFDTYTIFFEHKIMDTYVQHYLPSVLGYNDSSQRLDVGTYNTTFGTLIGGNTDINFLNGQLNHIDELDQFIHGGDADGASRFYQYFDEAMLNLNNQPSATTSHEENAPTSFQ